MSEHQYLTTYNSCLAGLSESKGTLLADRNIVVAEGPRPTKSWQAARAKNDDDAKPASLAAAVPCAEDQPIPQRGPSMTPPGATPFVVVGPDPKPSGGAAEVGSRQELGPRSTHGSLRSRSAVGSHLRSRHSSRSMALGWRCSSRANDCAGFGYFPTERTRKVRSHPLRAAGAAAGPRARRWFPPSPTVGGQRIRFPFPCPHCAAATVPWCRSTNFLTNVKPSPRLFPSGQACRSPRTYGSKMRFTISGGMPTPVSAAEYYGASLFIRLERDLTSRLCAPGCIDQQVYEDLLQPNRIGFERDRLERRDEREFLMTCFHDHSNRLRGALHARSDVDRLKLQLGLNWSRARHRDQISGKARDEARTADRRGCKIAPSGGRRTSLPS